MPGGGFYPDAAAVALDDAAAQRQPDTGACELAAVQTLERPENPVMILGIDTIPVVANGDQPLAGTVSFGAYFNAGRIRGPIFQRVSNQVLEDLSQLRGVAPHHRKVATDNLAGICG